MSRASFKKDSLLVSFFVRLSFGWPGDCNSQTLYQAALASSHMRETRAVPIRFASRPKIASPTPNETKGNQGTHTVAIRDCYVLGFSTPLVFSCFFIVRFWKENDRRYGRDQKRIRMEARWQGIENGQTVPIRNSDGVEVESVSKIVRNHGTDASLRAT